MCAYYVVMTKSNRRQQNPKPRNAAMHKGMMELRQGSRTTLVPSGKRYTRKTKHREW